MTFVAKNFWTWWWIKWAISNLIHGIWWWLKLRCYIRPKWRSFNKHNSLQLISPLEIKHMNKIKVWNYTYWWLNCKIWYYDWVEIQIWNYCSISPDSTFFCGHDHARNHLSTYSFWYWRHQLKQWDRPEWLWNNQYETRKNESKFKWKIIIWDDVRIWANAVILWWVNIWQWAVIAAWSVVTKDIPPYSIAWWNPAKVITYRFSPEKIKKLLQINYSNIPIENFRKIYPETIKQNFDIDYLLKVLK